MLSATSLHPGISVPLFLENRVVPLLQTIPNLMAIPIYIYIRKFILVSEMQCNSKQTLPVTLERTNSLSRLKTPDQKFRGV